MIFNTKTLAILIIGFLMVLWYCMALGYMYQQIGNSDDFSSYSNRWGLILGVAMLGCIALAVGITALGVVWLGIENAALTSIVVAVLALGASISSLSVAAIGH
jgi:hypothetical protein